MGTSTTVHVTQNLTVIPCQTLLPPTVLAQPAEQKIGILGEKEGDAKNNKKKNRSKKNPGSVTMSRNEPHMRCCTECC